MQTTSGTRVDLISRCEPFRSCWPTGELGFLSGDSLDRPKLAIRLTVSFGGLLHLPPPAKLAPLELYHSYLTRTTHAPPASLPPGQSSIQIAATSSNPPCNEGCYLPENNLKPEVSLMLPTTRLTTPLAFWGLPVYMV